MLVGDHASGFVYAVCVCVSRVRPLRAALYESSGALPRALPRVFACDGGLPTVSAGPTLTPPPGSDFYFKLTEPAVL